MKKSKIAITGSRGFIGSYLKKSLEQDGHTIIEWDNKIQKDISDFELGDADAVVHLAALADVRRSIKEPEIYWKTNVEATTRIQRLCNTFKIPLYYASSSCIHKWWLSPYGTSKKVNEETAFPGQIGLRFTTVYGHGARDTMLISRIINNSVKYSTRHKRDFIHVEDVVSAIKTLMEKWAWDLGSAYDIGVGKSVYVNELVKSAGYDVPVEEGDACEAEDNVANTSGIRLLGWKPQIDVMQFVKELKK